MAWFLWDAYYTQLAAELVASCSTVERRRRPASDPTLVAPGQTRPGAGLDLDDATRHRGVERFPHRNRPLGRCSTPEEVVFLATVLHGLGL
jgi:hypothetical protein